MHSRNNVQTPMLILTLNSEDTNSSDTNTSGLVLTTRFKFFLRVLGNLEDEVALMYLW